MIYIGIDGIVLRGRDAGSLRYFEQLLRGLAETDTRNQYIVFANYQSLSQAIPPQKNFLYQDVRPSLLPAALHQQLYNSWQVQGTLGLLHSPVFVPPLRFNGKTVMTVFDLAFVRYPQTKKWTGQLWWRLLGRRGIRKADRVIAISESTRRDLVNWGIRADKIRVVYPCIPASFKPMVERRAITTTYNLPVPYILFVGTLEPRKNVTTLIRAFALAKQRGALPHALVIAGQRGWLYQDIFRTVEQLELKTHVIFLGYVPDDDLPALYSGADLFAYLSWYEGFGLPVLEAMTCGVPVLTSNVSALPEVVGDAGILVAPDDPEQAASEMLRVLTDTELRHELSARGLARAALFSQERFARGILQVYEEVLRA